MERLYKIDFFNSIINFIQKKTPASPERQIPASKMESIADYLERIVKEHDAAEDKKAEDEAISCAMDAEAREAEEDREAAISCAMEADARELKQFRESRYQQGHQESKYGGESKDEQDEQDQQESKYGEEPEDEQDQHESRNDGLKRCAVRMSYVREKVIDLLVDKYPKTQRLLTFLYSEVEQCCVSIVIKKVENVEQKFNRILIFIDPRLNVKFQFNTLINILPFNNGEEALERMFNSELGYDEDDDIPQFDGCDALCREIVRLVEAS
jgi:hypothetical protein